MIVVENETAVKVVCICCGSEKYATQSPYLCHNCWKSGEAAKLIQQLTQRTPDAPKSAPVCTCSMDDGIHEWNCALEKARR